MTTSRDVERFLAELLDAATLPDTAGEAIAQEHAFDGARTFAESQVPSPDAGLYLRFRDRSEYQVIIVRSR